MLPYHPNSDALPPPPALPLLPAEPVFPLPLSEDLVFALAVFVLFFFSVLESDCSSLDLVLLSASFSAIRFRFLPELRESAPFLFRPALRVLAQRMRLKSLWAAP